MALSTSGSSGVRIPAELILTATGRVRAGGALAVLADGLVFKPYIRLVQPWSRPLRKP